MFLEKGFVFPYIVLSSSFGFCTLPCDLVNGAVFGSFFFVVADARGRVHSRSFYATGTCSQFATPMWLLSALTAPLAAWTPLGRLGVWPPPQRG